VGQVKGNILQLLFISEDHASISQTSCQQGKIPKESKETTPQKEGCTQKEGYTEGISMCIILQSGV